MVADRIERWHAHGAGTVFERREFAVGRFDGRACNSSSDEAEIAGQFAGKSCERDFTDPSYAIKSPHRSNTAQTDPQNVYHLHAED